MMIIQRHKPPKQQNICVICTEKSEKREFCKKKNTFERSFCPRKLPAFILEFAAQPLQMVKLKLTAIGAEFTTLTKFTGILFSF